MIEQPGRDCARCPRLATFRAENRAAYPDWFNAPVPSLGPTDARLLVVGLAPGLRGANRTGRPFHGDGAGITLYGALLKAGLAQGRYTAEPDDAMRLGVRIVNAVRCVPPQNKPVPAEIRACNDFLRAEFAGLARLRVILALGRIAHDAVLRALDLKPSRAAFGHGALHDLPDGRVLADSYHVSRYNMNTGVLTEAMFDAVLAAVGARLG
ncbi:MAG: uracil-DNA glycosylase [Rhodospirillales bacterium]|nr:uracil-DNA glycosylase [Rhodospirillales bacterium]